MTASLIETKKQKIVRSYNFIRCHITMLDASFENKRKNDGNAIEDAGVYSSGSVYLQNVGTTNMTESASEVPVTTNLHERSEKEKRKRNEEDIAFHRQQRARGR